MEKHPVEKQYLDFDRLSAWMDEQNLGDGDITDIERLAGGTQNILVKFKRNDQIYVLRRPPEHLRANSNKTMRREARVLGAIAGSEVPHPRLIANCPEEDVIGASFYLMEAIEGFNAAAEMPALHRDNEQIRHRMGLAMVEAICELGKLDYRKLGLEDFGKVEGYIERQVPRWQQQLDSYSQFENYEGPQIPGLEDVSKWLKQNEPKDWQAGIIHGDYHIGNVMFKKENAELAALVDWELSTIGDPLIDLGWMMATWSDDNTSHKTGLMPNMTGFTKSEDLIEHYGKHSSRDLNNITWYAVLACYKLGIILEGTYARAAAGKAPKETGDFLHNSTLTLFERAKNWIE